MRELARRTFRDLDRDVAGETLRHHDIGDTHSDIGALDEPDIFEVGQVGLAQNAAGLAHLFKSLDLFDPDVEQPDARPLDVEQHLRHRAAHHRHVGKMLGIGADRSADVEHDGLALERRPQRRDCRTADPRHGAQVKLGHRHEGTGIAGRDCDVRLAFFHRVYGKPHR